MEARPVVLLLVMVLGPSSGRAWTAPENLGPPVNGPCYDGHPCVSADATELYLTSDRAGGTGSLDLYITEENASIEPTSLGRLKVVFH